MRVAAERAAPGHRPGRPGVGEVERRRRGWPAIMELILDLNACRVPRVGTASSTLEQSVSAALFRRPRVIGLSRSPRGGIQTLPSRRSNGAGRLETTKVVVSHRAQTLIAQRMRPEWLRTRTAFRSARRSTRRADMRHSVQTPALGAGSISRSTSVVGASWGSTSGGPPAPGDRSASALWGGCARGASSGGRHGSVRSKHS